MTKFGVSCSVVPYQFALRNVRSVARAGYGVMLALLLFSAFEAYRIQETTSRHAADIYREQLRQQDLLFQFRRNLLVAGINARDFLLNPGSDRSAALRTQLKSVKAETDRTLEELDRFPSTQPSMGKLRSIAQDYWNTIEPMMAWPADIRDDEAYQFVQREIAPRRQAGAALARHITAMNHQALEDSEAELVRSRQGGIRRLLIILGLSVAIGSAVAGFSLRYAAVLERQNADHFKDIVQSHQELSLLSNRLLQVQEEERRRLSRELHDEVGQTLTALRIEVSRALSSLRSEPAAIEERLERAHELAERSVRAVKDIAVLLRPSVLDDIGLAAALKWQIRDFTRRTGIACQIACDCRDESLPDAVKTCAYRVVQEALHNVEKHARATSVAIKLTDADGVLSVEIADDGCGFVSAGQGLGLVGMRERAAANGGAVEIDSAPGRGTTVRLSIPAPAGERKEVAAG